MEITKSNDYSDLKLASSLIGYMAMCKLGKISQAQEYLENATEQFNIIIREEASSKYNRESCSNLYCIFTLSGEILQNPQALSSLRPIVTEILKKISFENCSTIAFVEKLINDYEWDNSFELISCDEFQDFLFLVAFFPFIANTTPVLNINEILREKSKSKGNLNLSGVLSPNKAGKINNSYGYLMKTALVKFKTP